MPGVVKFSLRGKHYYQESESNSKRIQSQGDKILAGSCG